MSCKDLDIESKFAKAFHNLSNIRPFYCAIYESMQRVESNGVSTMGVTCKKMIYNKKFVESLEFEELMFVDLHEIAHVALMHVSRRKNRDPELWNIACDLYANRLLAEEFDIIPGETDSNGLIKFLPDALYCGTIDLENDYVERIYEDLYQQAQKNGYNNSKLQDIQDGKSFHFEYQGTGGSDSSCSKSSQSYGYGKSDRLTRHQPKFEMDLKPGTYSLDISDDGSDQLGKENDNRKILQDARTRYEMSGRSAGNGAGLLKFKVDEILKSHLDWRKLLRKYCIRATRSDTSFARPDKRMYYQRAIYPGQALDGMAELKGVKVCFDSSGSISDTDIAYFYGQVKDILKEFKLKAELIYWDTDIASCGDFSDFAEMKRVEACGRGGTNPTCLFEYFDSKRCKVKPVVTLVFTDGYIGGDLNRPKWRKNYKDTIWIMTKDYDKGFKPAFGQLAIARFSD